MSNPSARFCNSCGSALNPATEKMSMVDPPNSTTIPERNETNPPVEPRSMRTDTHSSKVSFATDMIVGADLLENEKDTQNNSL